MSYLERQAALKAELGFVLHPSGSEYYGYQGDDPAQRYKDLRFDNKLTFNKVTDVYHAAVAHNEDQPAHLHVLDTNICVTRCTQEYANPCQRFCPAAVFTGKVSAEMR